MNTTVGKAWENSFNLENFLGDQQTWMIKYLLTRNYNTEKHLYFSHNKRCSREDVKYEADVEFHTL
jgi:hypothetical protein